MTAYSIDMGYKKQCCFCSCCGLKLKSNARKCPKCLCNIRNEHDVMKDGNQEEIANFAYLTLIAKMCALIGIMGDADNGR